MRPCSLVLAALFFAFVPWGFASFLNGDDTGAGSIGGGGGEGWRPSLRCTAEVGGLLPWPLPRLSSRIHDTVV